MEEERFILAIGRIERALSRIASLSARGQDAREPNGQESAVLRDKHDRLRAEIADVVEQLDGLIEREAARESFDG